MPPPQPSGWTHGKWFLEQRLRCSGGESDGIMDCHWNPLNPFEICLALCQDADAHVIIRMNFILVMQRRLFLFDLHLSLLVAT